MTMFKKTVGAIIALMLSTTFSNQTLAQYVVDFEGTGEESGSYPAVTVSLSGIDWQIGPEVQIGTANNDFKNGNRSARLRGRNGSVLEQLQDKPNGMGTVSFLYRRYGSDGDQQPWAVEYSDNEGTSWTQIGSDITATETVQTFQETVNIEGGVRLRIRLASTPGTSDDRRMNVDDITITDYIPGAPVLTASTSSLNGFTYIEENGPSAVQTLIITGSNLVGTGDIEVQSTANFELSTDGISYVGTILLPFEAGEITGSGELYVRLAAGLNPGIYTGSITISGGSATVLTINTNGDVLPGLYPQLHSLASGAYSFTEWSDNASAYTYPSNMRLWTSVTDQVALDQQPEGVYTGAYNLTSASRINGLNTYGVSFIATGSIGAGYPLGAVLGVNTLGKENIEVSWTGGLVTQGAGTPTPRFYGLRLQYQIGQGTTWTDVAGPVEYLNENKIDGDFEDFGPTVLPSACNNQPEVYLRWVYHFIAANDGGSRPNIRLDEILVDGSDIIDPSIQTSTVALSGFNQLLGAPSTEQTFTVSGENLTEDITLTVSGEYEISLTSGTGFTSSVVVPHVVGTVTATDIYVRLNATVSDSHTGTITVTSQNAANVVVDLNGQTTEPQAEADLLYYWHFNNMDGGPDVTEIIADYSYLPTFDGKFTYTDPIAGERDIDRYSEGSSLNLKQGEGEGYSARVRNPSLTRSLVFDVPTTGAEGIRFEYAVQRSGQGMLNNIIEYSVDGVNFISTGLSDNTQEVVGSDTWQLFAFDFTSITAVDDNPDFKIKITWDGNTTASNGNNRYDNITLTAELIDLDASVSSVSGSADLKVYPTPFEGNINISSLHAIKSIQVIDLLGKVVKSEAGNNTPKQQISMVDLNSGTYIFMIETTEGVYQLKSVKR